MFPESTNPSPARDALRTVAASSSARAANRQNSHHASFPQLDLAVVNLFECHRLAFGPREAVPMMVLLCAAHNRNFFDKSQTNDIIL